MGIRPRFSEVKQSSNRNQKVSYMIKLQYEYSDQQTFTRYELWQSLKGDRCWSRKRICCFERRRRQRCSTWRCRFANDESLSQRPNVALPELLSPTTSW